MNDDDQSIDLRLLANFVHQVINPLNGVIGTLDNIIEGAVPEHRREQRLKAIRAQLEHAVLLVRNLAYFSQMSTKAAGIAQAADILQRKCVIPQIIIEAALYFQEEGLSQGVKIHLEDRQTQYSVSGSPELLRQVFMNLFDNAIKYGDSGSQVRVVTRASKRQGGLFVEIFGSGDGFAFDERERIFELGYRANAAKGRVASGTGLGLFICRKIMEDVHHGKITAECSQSQRKTTFRLWFPNYTVP